jgi:hypothetical protein
VIFLRKFILICTLATLGFAALTSPLAHAADEATGHKEAKRGQAIAMVLGIIGIASVAKGTAMLADENPAGALWVAGGIAEIAGAAIATSNNGQTAAQTKGEATDLSSHNSSAPDLSGLGFPPGTTLSSLCAKGGSGCTCNNADCTNVTTKIPSYDEVKSGLENAYKYDPAAYKGMNLQDALADLNENYKKASKLTDEINEASRNGTLGSSTKAIASDSPLDGLKGKDLNGNKDGVKNAGENTGKAEGTADASLIVKAPEQSYARPPVAAVNRHGGLVLEDARTGRLLTIFERVSRAIRGDHDRDLILAKVEWARKDIARKNKLREIKARTLANALQ